MNTRACQILNPDEPGKNLVQSHGTLQRQNKRAVFFKRSSKTALTLAVFCDRQSLLHPKPRLLFCPEKPGPLGQVRVLRLSLEKRCKSLK